MDMPLHEGFPVAPRSAKDIRAHAEHARQVLGMPEGQIAIAKVLDQLTSYGLYYDVLDQRDWPNAREVEACYHPEERTMYIRDNIYREMIRGGQRAVFTFGHELGHALLGHVRTANRQSGSQVPPYCQSEWQANCFAADFTMPVDQIVRYNLQTAEALARFFGVSPAAARVRLAALRNKGVI